MRFTMRLDPWWRWLLFLFGVRPGRADVVVETDNVLISFGFFTCRLPRTNIVGARRANGRWYYGIGWHVDFVGGIIVNGSLAGLVELELEPRVPLRLLGIPIRCRWVFLSLEQPDELIAALGVPAPS